MAGKGNLTANHLCKMERKMMHTLGYKLTPITLVAWADIYTRLWDKFATEYNLHQFCEHGDLAIRQFTFYSYQRLRVLFSILDCVALDFESKRFD
jgi:acyl carrier protein phosphodiesterase